MIEIKEHKAYGLLESRYERVGLDYVILQADQGDSGPEAHRKAVIEAFHILNERFAAYGYAVDIEADRMAAVRIGMDELLELPADAYYDSRPKGRRSIKVPRPLPYWYAFLEPPHGTPYLTADFTAFNAVLFPDRDDAEAYRWNDGFSDYFDAGREWWGTGLWTVFDRKSGVMVVIGASLTD